MGIEGRDYYRQSTTDRGWSGWTLGIPPVCRWVIVANILVFLLQIFIHRPGTVDDVRRQLRFRSDQGVEANVEEVPDEELARFVRHLPPISLVQSWFQLETHKVLHGQVWRLLTHAFCHDPTGPMPMHLLLNMLFFFWFGPTLESMYGSREFLWFYLAAAVTSGVAYVGLDLITSEAVPAIGASGAVMGVTMLYAIHYPRTVIYVLMLIPVEIRWLLAIYVLFDLHPVLLALAGRPVDTGVAHAAHLGGLTFGYVYWKFDWRLSRFMAGFQLPRSTRVLGPPRTIRMYRPPQREPDTASDAQVDEILRKIQEHGSASLTDAERQVLIDASRRYQDRNR